MFNIWDGQLNNLNNFSGSWYVQLNRGENTGVHPAGNEFQTDSVTWGHFTGMLVKATD